MDVLSILLPITKVTILKREHQTDYIILHTRLPAATFPFDGNQTIHFDTAKDIGVDYCREHFPNIPIEIINTKPI